MQLRVCAAQPDPLAAEPAAPRAADTDRVSWLAAASCDQGAPISLPLDTQATTDPGSGSSLPEVRTNFAACAQAYSCAP